MRPQGLFQAVNPAGRLVQTVDVSGFEHSEQLQSELVKCGRAAALAGTASRQVKAAGIGSGPLGGAANGVASWSRSGVLRDNATASGSSNALGISALARSNGSGLARRGNWTPASFAMHASTEPAVFGLRHA